MHHAGTLSSGSYLRLEVFDCWLFSGISPRASSLAIYMRKPATKAMPNMTYIHSGIIFSFLSAGDSTKTRVSKYDILHTQKNKCVSDTYTLPLKSVIFYMKELLYKLDCSNEIINI